MLLLAMLLAAGPAMAGERLALTPLRDRAPLAAARAAAGEAGLGNVRLAERQSFRVARGTVALGSLVAGRGDVGGHGVCFAALVASEGTVRLLQTVGTGDWEAVSCLEVEAVGLVGRPSGVGLIYRATSPNAEVLEPVVLSLDVGPRIDAAASEIASFAGATTLSGMRRALRNAP